MTTLLTRYVLIIVSAWLFAVVSPLAAPPATIPAAVALAPGEGPGAGVGAGAGLMVVELKSTALVSLVTPSL